MIVNNNLFFRKGETGDWKNHLINEMIEHLEKITLEKLFGYGLTFGTL